MDFTPIVAVVVFAGLGACVSSALACVPGLHVYNMIGVLIIVLGGRPATPELLIPLIAGMVAAYSILNSIPSILMSAPDESAFLTVLPGRKYMMEGRGHEAVLLTAAGSALALPVLIAICIAAGPHVLPVAAAVFRPHLHWMIWCVIVFMIMSEWPKIDTVGWAGWSRFRAAWRSTGMGILTFALSGLLGFVLFYRSPIAVRNSFQNLTPAFAGLFAVPWLLLNVVSRADMPAQHFTPARAPITRSLLRGSVAGLFGGGFAAFLPAVTGGVGGMLAGHAVGIRDSRCFLVSQGASKLVYYVGALLLSLVPTTRIVRGGAAWALTAGMPLLGTRYELYLGLSAAAVGGTTGLLLVSPLTRLAIRIVRRFGYARVSLVSLSAAPLMVCALTGLPGLAVMVVAAGIGLLPVLFGSRRMNCLGVILLPLACNMSGIGVSVARFLGLL